ncbi:MAG TPA: permease-like cell division protein FtsX [Candidatus Paceibacterota bacterium]|jgi:cell division transport system permease protein|nr:permease-like cell division protein FtsX [Candidatus Paceibacterota bacterium]
MTELKRIIKAGYLNFKRSGLISFAAVLVVTITLSFITSIIILQSVLYFSLNNIKEKVDITIYFNPGTSEDKILSLEDSLLKLPEVADVVYTSDKEALELFRSRHENDYPTIAALDEIGTNPLGAYLNVKAKDTSQYEGIANFLKADNPAMSNYSNSIDKINYNQNKLVIDRLNSIISGAQKLGFLITLLLITISIIITFNTIRLAIFISRDEIAVMRLVGASKMYVRGPFMVEGVIYGIIATFVTLAIFWPVTFWLGIKMTNFFGFNIYDYYVSNILQIFIINLLFGVFLGIVSSSLAVRRYLNK